MILNEKTFTASLITLFLQDTKFDLPVLNRTLSRSSRSESQTGVDTKLNIPIPIPLGFLENNTKMRMMVLYHGKKGRSISLFLAILENLYILGGFSCERTNLLGLH
ncbi:vacuolar fusion protein MON1 protein [Trifolium repens]|nr:vacuolar fusion protein MON1 protein [Trifolium repens]